MVRVAVSKKTVQMPNSVGLLREPHVFVVQIVGS